MEDIQKDQNLDLLKVAIEKQNPKIKTIVVKSIRNTPVDIDYNDLHDEAFANKQSRLFPIFSPGHAVMSALYMMVQKTKDEIAKERCKSALVAFKLNEILDILEDNQTENEAPIIKIASEHENVEFLLPSIGKLPVSDKDMLEKSASILVQNFDSLTQSEKLEGAGQLTKIASEYGVDINNPKIKSYALQADSDLIKVGVSLIERMAMAGDRSEYQDIYNTITKEANTNGKISSNVEFLKKIAFKIMDIDKKNNIYNEFETITDVFNTPKSVKLQKTASSDILIDGQNIDKDQILSLSSEKVELLFGEQINFSDDNEKLEKVANFIESLPLVAKKDAIDLVKA